LPDGDTIWVVEAVSKVELIMIKDCINMQRPEVLNTELLPLDYIISHSKLYCLKDL
jgi:hypothetical protein